MYAERYGASSHSDHDLAPAVPHLSGRADRPRHLRSGVCRPRAACRGAAADRVSSTRPPLRRLLDDVLAIADGLLLTGGGDVDPAIYGASGERGPDAAADDFELALIAAARERALPTLAVCRGRAASGPRQRWTARAARRRNRRSPRARASSPPRKSCPVGTPSHWFPGSRVQRALRPRRGRGQHHPPSRDRRRRRARSHRPSPRTA